MDASGRPNELNDVLLKLHEDYVGATKYGWAPHKPHVYENIVENSGFEGTLPTEQEMNDMLAEMQTEFDNDYKRRRREDYPAWEDQLDMQYHDAVNGTSTWVDVIAAVKAKYPKP